MPFAVPFAIPGFLTAIFNFWNKLPSPIKVIIIGLIFGFICFKAGERKQIKICYQEKAASIAEAKRIDREASATALRDMQTQRDKYQKQALETENKLNEAATLYSQLPEECKSNQEFIDRNNSIGGNGEPGKLRNNTVPGDKKRLTPRRQRSSASDALQESENQ